MIAQVLSTQYHRKLVHWQFLMFIFTAESVLIEPLKSLFYVNRILRFLHFQTVEDALILFYLEKWCKGAYRSRAA